MRTSASHVFVLGFHRTGECVTNPCWVFQPPDCCPRALANFGQSSQIRKLHQIWIYILYISVYIYIYIRKYMTVQSIRTCTTYSIHDKTKQSINYIEIPTNFSHPCCQLTVQYMIDGLSTGLQHFKYDSQSAALPAGFHAHNLLFGQLWHLGLGRKPAGTGWMMWVTSSTGIFVCERSKSVCMFLLTSCRDYPPASMSASAAELCFERFSSRTAWNWIWNLQSLKTRLCIWPAHKVNHCEPQSFAGLPLVLSTSLGLFRQRLKIQRA